MCPSVLYFMSKYVSVLLMGKMPYWHWKITIQWKPENQVGLTDKDDQFLPVSCSSQCHRLLGLGIEVCEFKGRKKKKKASSVEKLH